MGNDASLIRNISDTALLVAIYRARENERPDAVFRDPFARRLAGEHGEQIARSLAFSEKNAWSFVMRTYLYDQFITEQIAQGVDMVVNLGAGLDARPYRMALPPTLQWIEVDLPDILTYKEELLRGETPGCKLERVRLDLSKADKRRELFQQLGRRANRVLVVTEGLIIYLSAEEVASLAQDLASQPSFHGWVIDPVSPGLFRMLQKNMGAQFNPSGSVFKFAPPEGPGFFAPYGWKAVSVQSLLKTAARLKRLSFWMQLLSHLPESNDRQGSRPWSAACLLAR